MPNTIQIRDEEGNALYPITDKSLVAGLNASGSSLPSGGMLPDEVYDLGELSGSVSFILAAAVSGKTNYYTWSFSTGATPPTPTWPVGVTLWAGNCIDQYGAPGLSANKTYEVSVKDGHGLIFEW